MSSNQLVVYDIATTLTIIPSSTFIVNNFTAYTENIQSYKLLLIFSSSLNFTIIILIHRPIYTNKL